MSFCGTVLAIFVTLKCAGLVAWPWWFVLSPAILNISLSALVFVFVYIKRNQEIKDLIKRG